MMNGMSSGSLQPTWRGHVSTARDALVLFEACLDGTLYHVPRRPHDRERSSLIRSGHVFIYEENASGIKRWTDGVPWSPSRILGNFLVYRELVKPFPPGEKKRAQKRPKTARSSKPGEPYPRRGSGDEQQPSPGTLSRADPSSDSRDSERALIGSLVDSYGFKEGGLVKKTMSVNLNGIHHHLVSYYRIEDVLDGVLPTPSSDKRLQDVEPRRELIARQNFRAPLDDIDMSMQDPLMGMPTAYEYGRSYQTNPLLSPLGQPQRPLGFGAYGTAPFSTTSQIQSGLQSYAPVSQTTPPFFSTSSSLSQAIISKHEPYTSYADYQGSQNGQLPVAQDVSTQQSHGQSIQPFSYRPNSVTSASSRVHNLGSGASITDTKSTDSSDWTRSSASAYSSVGSPLSAHFLSNTSPWPMATPMNQSLTRPEEGWGAMPATLQCNMNTGQEGSRQPSFQMPSQSALDWERRPSLLCQ